MAIHKLLNGLLIIALLLPSLMLGSPAPALAASGSLATLNFTKPAEGKKERLG